MRFLIRLSVLALAAFGAKTLYERFAPRLNELRGPASQFVDRTSRAVQDSADRAREAAREAAGAFSDTANEVKRAADDAAVEASRRMSGEDAGTSATPGSSGFATNQA
jgi:hypothetical protein